LDPFDLWNPATETGHELESERVEQPSAGKGAAIEMGSCGSGEWFCDLTKKRAGDLEGRAIETMSAGSMDHPAQLYGRNQDQLEHQNDRVRPKGHRDRRLVREGTDATSRRLAEQSRGSFRQSAPELTRTKPHDGAFELTSSVEELLHAPGEIERIIEPR